ncbi:MAG TPA: Veg family protein [Eubacteriales bacterium]|nr:Veg family protein [Clostridia bacterium]HRX14433.1 Veg family protein [Eubacteriales bacterium]
MRKAESGIDKARQTVEDYFGKEVAIRYNKGRNRICHYKGKITQMYDNIFVVTIYNEIFDRLSCSYSDIVCGEIAFKEI